MLKKRGEGCNSDMRWLGVNEEDVGNQVLWKLRTRMAIGQIQIVGIEGEGLYF